MGKELTCVNELMNRMGQFDHVDYKGGLTSEGILPIGHIQR